MIWTSPTREEQKIFSDSFQSSIINFNDHYCCLCSRCRYVPTLDDVEMYKSQKGPVADLHIVDQYMMEVRLLIWNYNFLLIWMQHQSLVQLCFVELCLVSSVTVRLFNTSQHAA